MKRDLKKALGRKRPDLLEPNRLILHQDNAPCHKSRRTQEVIDSLRFGQLPHPPYSPDLAICDFSVFPTLKRELRGRHFESREEIISTVNTVLAKMSSNGFSHAFDQWEQRCKKCIQANGRYFEGLGDSEL